MASDLREHAIIRRNFEPRRVLITPPRRGRSKEEIDMSERTCAVETCERKISARGWCATHYQRWKMTGDVQADRPIVENPLRPRAEIGPCSIPTCDHRSAANVEGWCSAHYSRWQRTGDVAADRPLSVKRPGTTCSIEGCSKRHESRGFCRAHYTRWRKTGDARAEQPLRIALPHDTPCSIEGCGDAIQSHKLQLCPHHYRQYMKHGDPLINQRPDLGKSRADRFWSKVDKNGPLGCWIWTASITRFGYGQFVVMNGKRGRSRPAHCIAWELLRGPIPDGLVMDHRCRNRACVNPDHLEPVTNKENILRGIATSALNARKTHCLRGHEFTPENTYQPPNKVGANRQCRKCQKLRNDETRRKKRGQNG